jgi:hypothetical protein
MTTRSGREPLADELSSVLAHFDRVPAVLLDAAAGALRWRDPDALLAALVDDVPAELATVRGTPARMLSFQLGDVTIDLTVSVDEGRVAVIGQVAPVGVMDVEVRHPAGVWTGRTDALGRFAVANLPAGPMRVLARPEGGSASVGTPIFGG